jgi:peptide/nickel transport system ATP-binding protein
MFVLHQGANWSEAMDRAEEALRQVRVPSPERRIKDYPHQLSGGMRQRVMIAIALACGPELLIADEPTTALDVTVQAEIIDLMAELCAAKGTAILMISHDLGLVANMCRRVAVMYAGRIVEAQVAEAIFAAPRHPYTQGLVDSLPRLGERSRRGQQKLREIAGVVPSIATYPAGCRFNPRCSAVTDICRRIAPEITPLPADGLVRCHHHG